MGSSLSGFWRRRASGSAPSPGGRSGQKCVRRGIPSPTNWCHSSTVRLRSTLRHTMSAKFLGVHRPHADGETIVPRRQPPAVQAERQSPRSTIRGRSTTGAAPGAAGCQRHTLRSGAAGRQPSAVRAERHRQDQVVVASRTTGAVPSRAYPHSRTVRSELPDARVPPSGLNATDHTAAVCPRRRAGGASGRLRSHTRTAPSRPPAANLPPSGLKATASTGSPEQGRPAGRAPGWAQLPQPDLAVLAPRGASHRSSRLERHGDGWFPRACRGEGLPGRGRSARWGRLSAGSNPRVLPRGRRSRNATRPRSSLLKAVVQASPPGTPFPRGRISDRRGPSSRGPSPPNG